MNRVGGANHSKANSGKGEKTAEPSPGMGHQFGAFKGVFTPSILTILGVVMFLRFGWVLGNVGLPLTLLIVVMSCSITFLTALSMSALATNRRIEGGGAYFIISRSLGVEPGAAIGLPLFMAQALGIAFYIAGFSESLTDVFPHWDYRTVALGTLAVLTLIAILSADLALKTQFVVMAAIGVALVSFFLGSPVAPGAGVESAATAAAPRLQPFWVVFAVFFPAVTGIEAGISMSGDLKNPSRALPRGTLAAVLCGFLVYLLIPLFLFWFARTGDGQLNRQLLVDDLLIVSRVARWRHAVVAGIWAAALSSAMGAILGAPRTLQALARDRIVPSVFGRGYGSKNEPRMAMLFSTALALVGLVLGDLNLIAPILSMFFLTSYGLLNVSAGLEQLIRPPSWRPSFKVPWPLSVLGCLGCFAVMLMINAGATVIALVLVAAIYWGMKQRKLKARWGDIRRGLLMQAAQHAIYTLARIGIDERNWKPNILVLSGNPTRRWYLIELAGAISQDRGLLTVAAMVPEKTTSERRIGLEKRLADFLEKQQISGLAKVYGADKPLRGAVKLAVNYGFGPIKPNTLLIGETEHKENYRDFSELICAGWHNNLNMVVVREGETEQALAAGARIDVWWGGQQENLGFMLALAHLLTTSKGWRQGRMQLNTIVENEKAIAGTEEKLREYIAGIRVRAVPSVIVRCRDNLFEQIREHSQGADLVFLGIRHPEPDESVESYADYYAGLLRNTEGLPPAAMVMAAEKIDFSRIFTETAQG